MRYNSGMNLKVVEPLTETPEPGSVSEDYYFRMLSPHALVHSAPFLDEEKKVLKNLLENTPNVDQMNLVAVGAGELWYLRFGLKYTKNYVSIEPLSDTFLNDSVKYLTEINPRITILNKRFRDVKSSELPECKSIFVFLFNILAYLENPLENINKLIKPGDMLFFSSWNQANPLSRSVRKQYFDFLNSFEKDVIIDPEGSVGICKLDNFPFSSLKSYQRHERITDEITDILIIYT